jgi:hypothetical protein
MLKVYFIFLVLLVVAGKSSGQTNSIPSDSEIRRLLPGMWGFPDIEGGTSFNADGHVSAHSWRRGNDRHIVFEGSWQVTNGCIYYFNERSNNIPLVQTTTCKVVFMNSSNLVYIITDKHYQVSFIRKRGF